MLDGHEIYLDANATVRPLDKVITAVRAAMATCWGNPSSEHGRGIPARRLLTRARDATSAMLPGLHSEDVVLTSGGTEGSNTILASAGHNTTVIVTQIEHPATLEPAGRALGRGAAVVAIPVDNDGRSDPDEFRRALIDARSNVVVSVQWANGETGVVQPIGAIAETVRRTRPDAFLHVDAAQAVGRIPTPAFRGISAITFSGHKLHGPQGTGALAFADGAAPKGTCLLAGGGQEGNRRSGTQNVAGAAGLATALELRQQRLADVTRGLRTMRDTFEAMLQEQVPDAHINGLGASRVPNTSSIRFAGVDGMALVAHLDHRGIRCSQGSACSSGRPEPSYVLRAMGLSEEQAYSTVRFSFSALNTDEEVEAAADTVASIVESIR